MESLESKRNFKIEERYNSDEIDITKLFRHVKRFKKLFSIITLSSISLSLLYGFLKKPTWKGEFQIVLSEKDTQSALINMQNPAISKLIGLNSGSSNLRTEVEILKSPSVLMPIFNFVKVEKEKDGEDVKNWYFSDWIRDLDVELETGTSVLNISYKDKKRDIILDVLNKISYAYQNYSGKERMQSLNKGINFLEEQINIYSDKSSSSLKKAMSFAIKNDLLLSDNQKIIPNQNVEFLRIDAINKIRNVDQLVIQLKELKKIDDDDAYFFFVKSIPDLSEIKIIKEIDLINDQMARRRTTFTESDESIQNLIKRKKISIKLLKEKSLAFLKAKRAYLLAQQYAAERTEETLIKYKELFSKAQSNQKVLMNLKSEKRLLSLEKAKTKDPWELITEPTLLSKPLAVSKKIYLVLGFIIGIFISSIYTFIITKRKDLLNYDDEVNLFIDAAQIGQVSLSSNLKAREDIKFISNGINNRFQENPVIIFPVGDIPKEINLLIIKEFKKQLSDKILVTNDLNSLQNKSDLILLLFIGITEKNEIKNLNKLLLMQEIKTSGWIAIIDCKDKL